MTGIVIGYVSFFLYNLSMSCFQRIIFLDPVEFIGVVAGNEHNVVVLIVE